jgi:DNA-binding SARP family transcriptional activator
LPNVVGSGERTRIQLCGRLSVELDGAELAGQLRGRQVPLLLAYLVLSRSRTVGREELIGALWPDNAPLSQDGALRTLLSRLRSALGSEVLVGRDELVLELPEPAWVDFEAASGHIGMAQEALEAGDARRAWALAQVPINVASRGLLPGAQATWLDARRRDLEDIHLQALELIGRAGLLLGGTQVSSVERAARSLIGAEPYRETGYVLLMQALQAQGNVAEGMRVFEQLRRLLREELGTAPSPEAIAVHEELLNPGKRAAPVAPRASGPPPLEIELPAELRVRAGAEMVGRVQEIGAIERWLSQSREEEPERVLLLGGDPGIGKTRLLAETAARAHGDGTLVLAGHSPEETLVPFQPFLEALGHYVQTAPTDELRTTARVHGAELVRLVPELRRRLPELAASTGGDPDTERYRLFEAVAGLLGDVAEQRPVLIVLDDLHWADRPTLLLLRHLARAPRAAGLSILGAYRITEQGNDGFNAALTSLRHERMLKQIEIKGLPERDASKLVGSRVGRTPEAEFLHALYTETEGNPFFLEEIIRHLQDSGISILGADAADLERVGLPDDVREVIVRRLERLDPASLEALRTASVIGRDFDASLLDRVLGLDEDAFLAALEQGLGARLVEQSPSRPDSYMFSHALIRETLYGTMSPIRRARLHRRIGLALEQEGAGRQTNAMALHFTRAAAPEDAERAIRYGLEAGAEATRMLAHEQAVEHYSRALEVLERFEPENRQLRCEVLLYLGETRVRAGERLLSWPVFREAAALAAELGDAERLARAAVGASRRYVQPPGIVDDELIALLEQALELTDSEPSVTRVLLLSRLCGALYFSPRQGEMRRLSAEATVLAARLSDPRAAALAAAARRRAYWAPDHLERRLADSTQLLRSAREADDPDLTLQGHAWLVVDLLEAGDRAAVEAQIEAFTNRAEELRQPLFLWQAAVWRAMKAHLAGHLSTAERLAEEALASGIRPERVTAPQYYSIQLLATRREQGRIGELEAPLRELIAEHPSRPAWRATLAMLLSDTGRGEEAREELGRLSQAGFEDIPKDGDWMTAMTMLAEVAATLREPEPARMLYGLMLPYRNLNVVVGIGAICQGSISRYLGRLALAMGDEHRALAHLEFALRANQALEAPVLAAHTQLDWALALGSGKLSADLFLAASRAAEELDLGLLRRRLEARAI